jgi:urea carboxylase
MFRKVLVANRGEIALCVLRTLRRMGIGSVAVYSDADRFTPAVLAADEAVRIGPAPAAQSYLAIGAILAACRQTGAQAVHPGYGFLSENPGFVDALEQAGIAFVGPTGEQMRRFGLKHSARAVAEANGVPMLPGSLLLADIAAAEREAARIGFPVMLKSTAGGGGIGMQLCHDLAELRDRFATVQLLSRGSFGDDRVYLEKFVSHARHVEVQIFGDGAGRVVALGERDCSLQRRHQKIVEETPAPCLSEATRHHLHAAAVALGEAVRYRSAGTVEFLYDPGDEKFYFLEVNTRLQVEHPVTEGVFGVDLVEWMIRQAAGELVLPAQADLVPRGCAIEARLYAEDPAKNFRPSSGLLTEVRFPDNVRVDGWVATGTEITPYYDPLLAKVIATGATRDEAIDRLAAALDASALWGIESNIAYVRAALDLPAFRAGAMTTATLGAFKFTPRSIDVLVAGTQSSVQDWPGRLGYWDVGVPPSGPMDARSFRLANRAVGNAESAAALELTLTGPTLRFNVASVIALAGARMQADLDGAPVPWFAPVAVQPGQVLRLGGIEGPGSRAYLAVRHGIDAPLYLGSRATFALGRFGGAAGRALKDGDVLRLCADAAPHPPQAIPPAEQPALTHDWTLGVLYGPHGAPDFFTEADIATLFSAVYEVHYNSARTGVRLIGPKPAWARQDGGEAGLHPSNIHDNAYAIGAIDFTGDMPILLGPDGPSLGGFVCPAVVTAAELWKLGQLRPGDKVRFVPENLAAVTGFAITGDLPGGVLRRHDGIVPVCYRIAGHDNLLVEYGEMVLDIALRLRVQLLLQALQRTAPPGLVDLTPGIRSLQIHYDPRRLPLAKLLDLLTDLETSLPTGDDITVPSRIVHLPLSWDDAAARLAMRKYQELVRPNAPWCPSNIEFIRRINGLDNIDDVRRLIFDASYLVLGLGDVYLGAPVATPIDPRHRLVTTKYNPARTWTPENAVGIGGAYLCVYGMEGPGGYQLFGRTIQMWNPWRSTAEFELGKPWLLRCFDQIRLFPVSHEELEEARAAFPHGQYRLRIEPASFSLRDYKAGLARDAAGIAAFKHTRQTAFEAERRRWQDQGLDLFVEEPGAAAPPAADALPPGAVAVTAPIQGNVWKVAVTLGQKVAVGDVIVVLEAMKSEIRVTAPVSGRVTDLTCQPGRMVQDGQRLAVLERDGAA